MFVESIVCLANQLSVKTSLTNSRFVASDKNNRVPHRIKREGDSPNATRSIETKFFHVGMP